MHAGPVVWMTGASSGIGRALCLGLARRGWRVAASSRSCDKLQTLADEAPDDTVSVFPLDVTDRGAVEDTVRRIEHDLGPIDACILNAGDYRPMKARDFDIDLFRRLTEVNYMGVIHGLGALLPHMLERRRGRVLLTASVAGYRGLPLAGPYGATKAALINLAETLRAELADSGVVIRVINPGFVKTPLTDKNHFHMPALITPEEAAAAILREFDGDHFEITFPKRFTWFLKLLRLLPYRLYFPAIRRTTGG